jgi:aryl-alcohol dehydrogenase-like predicted oxidoreductase
LKLGPGSGGLRIEGAPFYLYDRNVPIEKSVGALSELAVEGKIKEIGLSEISALTLTLRKAHAVHPIAAVQTEYSLWTRNPEIAVLQACREMGVFFVAFSPLVRAYLRGKLSAEAIHSLVQIINGGRRTLQRCNAVRN